MEESGFPPPKWTRARMDLFTIRFIALSLNFFERKRLQVPLLPSISPSPLFPSLPRMSVELTLCSFDLIRCPSYRARCPPHRAPSFSQFVVPFFHLQVTVSVDKGIYRSGDTVLCALDFTESVVRSYSWCEHRSHWS